MRNQNAAASKMTSNTAAETHTNAPYVIAKYIRLSVDDQVTESLSIPNQHKLLDRHIESLDIPRAEVLEFVENGFTGTSFERPVVQRMLELVYTGQIQCVVVKDFSRFGRNATESGYYMEKVFPLYDVRFISVSDGYDSDSHKGNTGGLNVAFKLLAHEYYSHDLSKKVKSAKRLQMKRGENIVARAVYGYRKNLSARKWEHDPPAAGIVKLIFDRVLAGTPTAMIRNELCAMRVPTPREYINQQRGTAEEAPKCVWTARMIAHILTNEQYMGSYVSGKQEQKRVGSHSKYNVDKSEWIVIPDRHPPIVSKVDFAKVQALWDTHLKNNTTIKPINYDLREETTKPRRLRMQNGTYKTVAAIYGYRKTGDGGVEIDEAAAVVVRQIYDMALQNMDTAAIKDQLTEAGILIPRAYMTASRQQLSSSDNMNLSSEWTVKSVRNILKNFQYTGAYVVGRILKDYTTGKRYRPPQSEWIVIPDKYPAVVSTETFEKAQVILAAHTKNKRRRGTGQIPLPSLLPPQMPTQTPVLAQSHPHKRHERRYLLKGMVACGCCGYALAYDSSHTPAYRCHHTYADPTVACHKMSVNADALHNAVLTLIQKHAEIVLNCGDLDELQQKSPADFDTAEYEARIRHCNQQRQVVYERFIKKELTQDEFLELKNRYTEEITAMRNQLDMFRISKQNREERFEKMAIAQQAYDELGERADKSNAESDMKYRNLVESLINKIRVSTGNQIEVDWKIAGFMNL